MDLVFLLEQTLNGLGYGLMLFLLAAGLTLVFGIMDTLNLAHGALFMAGAMSRPACIRTAALSCWRLLWALPSRWPWLRCWKPC